MNLFWKLALLILLPCLGTASGTGAQESAALTLSGTDWWIHEDPDGRGAERGMLQAKLAEPGWIPAAVPGNIQADLEAAHQLKPLWYGAGDERLHEVARKDWWYRKDFVIPPSFAGQRLSLVFDGVDHECEIWFNGQKIGGNAGMFRRFQFDVTNQAASGQLNRLAVRIGRMPEIIAPLVDRTDGQGVVNDATHFLRGIELTSKTLKELKSRTNWGWDWGVNIWTLGIWKDVRLEATGPARIDWTRVQTALNADFSEAAVTATLEIDSAVDLTATARFQITGQGGTSSATAEVALKKGENVVQANLTLPHPALWWPNGQGDQPLYTLQAELQSARDGAILDNRSARFGIRDLRWLHTEGAPEDFISRYQLILNGRPVRTIGSNLIPPDLLFGRMGLRTLHLLRQAKAAGANTLRLWGGGVILHEEAYDLADELGIMLIQELPLANHWPETDPVSLTNLEATARSIIKQVRNHPSIIELDGGNEMPWNSLTQHPALQLLQQIAGEEDDRLFRATCPDLGATHAPWFFDLRTTCRSYDERRTMRAGEFGSASPANLETWHRTIPPQSQWPITGIEEFIQIRKNIVQAVFEPDYWLRQRFLEDVFGTFDALPEMVEAGQFYGAEGLRYAIDAMRRKGKRLGGLTTWDFNEPWPNGAGSYLVDYDGRTLMSYDFFKQAIAPISLSLRYDSVFYDPGTGLDVELFLTSDAPQTVDVKWHWRARDRHGQVLDQGNGSTAIQPIEVKSLGSIRVQPPAKTAYGPLFLELRWEDSHGSPLGERLHVFAVDAVRSPWAGLLKSDGPDPDDDAVLSPKAGMEWPTRPGNLAFVGNGANPATASSARPEPIHQPGGLNDGRYGNSHSWIGTTPRSWFQVDLGKSTLIGRFKLGRDRTGEYRDRALDYLKIETSLDGQVWQTIFEQPNLASRPGFDPQKTMILEVTPVAARLLRVTVDPRNPAGGELACIDEFEVYAPAEEPPAALPCVTFHDPRPEIWRPVRRTTLVAAARPMRVEGGQQILELMLTNRGPMTALFCEPHPLIEYRTDLFIENNHCFIPPGESRVITIRTPLSSPRPLAGEGPGVRVSPRPLVGEGPGVRVLTLAQTGWRLTCWNAEEVMIEPSSEVLLALGRRDAMCREYAGYGQPSVLTGEALAELTGRRPDPGKVAYCLGGPRQARFHFGVAAGQSHRPARLRVHLSDVDGTTEPVLQAMVNDRLHERTLARGLGIQKDQPWHLAFPASVAFDLPADILQPGTNILELRLTNPAWVTLDAIDLTIQPR